MANATCGIYFCDGWMSGIALQPSKKGWRVIGGASLPATVEAGESLEPALKALGRAMKFSGGPVHYCLPKHQAIVRNVLLPSTDAGELTQMARFEAERHIPLHAERHSTGYHVTRGMGVEGSEVVLGAVDGPVVNQAVEGMLAAGMTPAGITLTSVALVNSLIFDRGDWINEKSLAIMSIGPEALDLVLILDGRLLFARAVTMDLRSLLESWMGFHAETGEGGRPDAARLAVAARMIDIQSLDEDSHAGAATGEREGRELVRGWLDRLVLELERTYDFARREMKCPPIDGLILTGEGAELRNLAPWLAERMGISVEILNPVGGLTGAKQCKFPFQGLEFTIPFGAMLGPTMKRAYRLDLTPREYYHNLARRRMTRSIIGTSALGVCALALATVSYLKYQDINSQLLAAYQKINEDMAPHEQELTEMRTKLGFIRGYLNDKNAALKVIDDIAKSDQLPRNDQSPRKVALSGIDYKRGKEVLLAGEVQDIKVLSQFKTDVKGTDHFAEVQESGNSTPRDLHGHPIYEFQLNCPLDEGKRPES